MRWLIESLARIVDRVFGEALNNCARRKPLVRTSAGPWR